MCFKNSGLSSVLRKNKDIKFGLVFKIKNNIPKNFWIKIDAAVHIPVNKFSKRRTKSRRKSCFRRLRPEISALKKQQKDESDAKNELVITTVNSNEESFELQGRGQDLKFLIVMQNSPLYLIIIIIIII